MRNTRVLRTSLNVRRNKVLVARTIARAKYVGSSKKRRRRSLIVISRINLRMISKSYTIPCSISKSNILSLRALFCILRLIVTYYYCFFFVPTSSERLVNRNFFLIIAIFVLLSYLYNWKILFIKRDKFEARKVNCNNLKIENFYRFLISLYGMYSLIYN